MFCTSCESCLVCLRGTSLYVVMLGGYRVFYALNWIYKKALPATLQMHAVFDFQQRFQC